MKMFKMIAIAMTTLSISMAAYTVSADAANRTGSHRVGGYTSHGKGSHYVGGYKRH